MRARKKQLRPRKRPRQERSRATVDAILEAAAYILLRDGWERLTTDRIAERAGVNIASLYQYFPSKHAVVNELHRRFREELRATVDASAPTPEAVTLPGVIRQGVGQAAATLAVNPALHRVFFEEFPRALREPSVAPPAAVIDFKNSCMARMVGVPDRELAWWIWDELLEGLLRAACIKRPELLKDPVFVDEIAILLERYLIRGA